ncbi:uncharacterized protein I303_100808 [Kwoniella dejecticola CBS 10117]|uniref:BTB domain-containing protein n=1 Tax=Kwoniella dejecticola CBS 10117 TaxID=1296121 RepID=A0A1A6AFZ4_9TREE|nr:uncharacterized protein I303_00810 [Kwoniella dejecticola CBS 10117]OBR88990.1 hypothetical protein I303_00810 [Kwoniella dejecticola CBS 10117]
MADVENAVFNDDDNKDTVHPFHNFGNVKLFSKDRIILLADCRRFDPTLYDLEFEQQKKIYEVNLRKYTSKAIELFLNMINVSEPRVPKASLPTLIELLFICQDCDMRDNEEMIELGMAREAMKCGHQWPLLIFACNDHGRGRDSTYYSLAEAALRTMTKEIFLHPLVIDEETQTFESVTFWEALEELPLEDRQQLLKLTIKMPEPPSNEIQVTDDWERVAKEFEPEWS